MIRTSVAFVAGVFLLQQFPRLPSLWWSAAALATALVLFPSRKLRFLAWFLLGCGWALVWAWVTMGEALDPSVEGKDLVVDGIVTTIPEVFDRGIRFGFAVDKVHRVAADSVPRKVRVSWYFPSFEIKAGDRWRFRVRLKQPHGRLNPGTFDYEKWLYLKGYRATGYVVKRGRPKRLQSPGQDYSIDRMRQALSDRVSTLLDRHPLRGIIIALVMGDRHGINATQWEVLRSTGTTHLVAISGLHIGLIAGLAFYLTHWVWLRCGRFHPAPSSVAACAAIIAATIYAALAGFSLPTQRALIMIALVMGSFLLRRPLRPGHTLALALFLVVLLDPVSVLAAGLWLSFSAVALITYVLAGRVRATRRGPAILKIHLVTAFGLAPLLLLHFNQIPLIAPLSNLIAVPVISLLVVPLILLGAALIGVAPVLADGLFTIAALVLEQLWHYLDWLVDLRGSQWQTAPPSVVHLVLAFFGLVLVFAPRGIPARWLGIPLLLPLFFPSPNKPGYGTLQFTLLDVGQGLAAVAQTAEHVLVFDTGARFGEGFDMGSAVIAPYLRSLGVRRIDRLIVSHSDNDHIGGARSLSREFPISSIYSSPGHEIDWAPVRPCAAHQKWSWDGVEFQILAPLTAHAAANNESSCVLKITSEAGSILLTGDIEKGTENDLVNYYGNEIRANVLVVPHHGSNTSSTAAFLRRVRPRFALVPSGYRNRYGFPRAEVIERLRRVGAKIYNTALSGAILIRFSSPDEPIVPQPYRASSGKYYHFNVATNDRSDTGQGLNNDAPKTNQRTNRQKDQGP